MFHYEHWKMLAIPILNTSVMFIAHRGIITKYKITDFIADFPRSAVRKTVCVM